MIAATDTILENVLQSGGPMAILAVVVVFLFRQYQLENAARLEALDARALSCEEDRRNIAARLENEREERRKSEEELWSKIAELSAQHSTGPVAVSIRDMEPPA